MCGVCMERLSLRGGGIKLFCNPWNCKNENTSIKTKHGEKEKGSLTTSFSKVLAANKFTIARHSPPYITNDDCNKTKLMHIEVAYSQSHLQEIFSVTVVFLFISFL